MRGIRGLGKVVRVCGGGCNATVLCRLGRCEIHCRLAGHNHRKRRRLPSARDSSLTDDEDEEKDDVKMHAASPFHAYEPASPPRSPLAPPPAAANEQSAAPASAAANEQSAAPASAAAPREGAEAEAIAYVNSVNVNAVWRPHGRQGWFLLEDTSINPRYVYRRPDSRRKYEVTLFYRRLDSGSYAFLCDCCYDAEFAASVLYDGLAGYSIQTQEDFTKIYAKICGTSHSGKVCKHVRAGPFFMECLGERALQAAELQPDRRAVFDMTYRDMFRQQPTVFSVSVDSQAAAFCPWRCYVFRNVKGYLHCERCGPGKDCEHCRRVIKHRPGLIEKGYVRARGSTSAAAEEGKAPADSDVDMPNADDYEIDPDLPPLLNRGLQNQAPIKCLSPHEKIPPGVTLPEFYPRCASAFCRDPGPDSKCALYCQCGDPSEAHRLCICGHAWDVREQTILVYDTDRPIELTYRAGVCSNPVCLNVKPFEPHKHGLFPVHPQYWFTYDFFLEIFNTVRNHIGTLNGIYTQLEERYTRREHKFDLVWEDFLAAFWLWVDYDGSNFDEDFECPECAKLPVGERIFILDGTMRIACKRKYLEGFPTCQHGMPGDEKKERAGDTVESMSPEDRTFLSGSGAQQLRTLLNKYTTGNGWEQLSHWPRLLELAAARPALATLLRSHPLPAADASIPCPEADRRFLRGLAARSSLNGFIRHPLSVIPILTNLVSKPGYLLKTDAAAQAVLTDSCPALLKSLRDRELRGESITPLRPLLRVLKGMLEKTRPPVCVPPDQYKVTVEQDLARNCFFSPTLRHCRESRNYAADKETTKERDDDEGNCERSGSAHGGLSPGLLGVYCPHGICVGFSIMKASEGERMVFQLFYNRCEIAPLIIVYDRACTLKTTCDKREPFFFYHSRFMLDVFHASNHVDCSEGFDPRVARDRSSLSQLPVFFNTQVAEQANAALTRITKSAAFMTPRHATLYVRSFLASFNRNKKKKLFA